MRPLRAGLLLLSLSLLQACAIVGAAPTRKEPPTRPPEIEQYYSRGNSYSTFQEEIIYTAKEYRVKRISIVTEAGLITTDYYQRNKSDGNLVMVFPLLGGKNVLVDYFADFFAKHGYEAAIVHRNDDFKDPKKFTELENIFRDGVVRDRVALDFFEKEYHKTKFGSFGISRGAINVAITAGVDPRLKYNVMAMGGTDLIGLFRHTKQKGIAKYIERVMDDAHITRHEFFTRLEAMVKTDPKELAKYIDPKKTLLMLAVLDRTVPFKYGERLRKQIGNPKTIYLLADHYTSALYTQFAKLFPPIPKLCVFPFDYIESEALAFYGRSFDKRKVSFRVLPYRIMQLPFTLLGELLHI